MKRELTAKEQQDILDQDPKYQAMMAEKLRKRAELEKMYAHDEAPLIKALNEIGWPENIRQCGEYRSAWDLVNTIESYPQLLDTLAEHISKPYHPKNLEGIARSLAVKEAKGTHIPRILMDELKKLTDPKDAHESGYRWALINTLVFIGDSTLKEDIEQLLRDPKFASHYDDLKRLTRVAKRKYKSK